MRHRYFHNTGLFHPTAAPGVPERDRGSSRRMASGISAAHVAADISRRWILTTKAAARQSFPREFSWYPEILGRRVPQNGELKAARSRRESRLQRHPVREV